MKRILSLVSLVLVVMLIINGCGISDTAMAVDEKLNVTVDRRVELLSIVQFLANFRAKDRMMVIEATQSENLEYVKSYVEDVKRHFGDFQEHPAVLMYEEMADCHGFTFDRSTRFPLSLDDNLTFRKGSAKETLTDYILGACGGAEKAEEFVTKLKYFREETNFDTFFDDHKSYYEQLIRKTQRAVPNSVATLIDYFGSEQHSYNIILVSLYIAGYGPRIEYDNKSYDVYMIGASIKEVTKYVPFMWHEFSHSYVNPLVDKHIGDLNQFDCLYRPIEKKMEAQAYANWRITIYEHIVRAVTARLVYHSYGNTSAMRELERNQGKGFIYIEPLYEKLEEYENNRDKYPTFGDFFPELIDVFKDLVQEKLETVFVGSLEGFTNLSPMTIITPTNEKANQDEKDITCFAQLVKDGWPQVKTIITDLEALNTNLSESSLMVLGTMDGNLWLKEHAKEFPFKVQADMIIADKEYHGNDLKYVTVFKHFENHHHGILILTAQEAANVASNIEVSGEAAYSDYVIMQGDRMVSSGIYNKINGEWKYETSD